MYLRFRLCALTENVFNLEIETLTGSSWRTVGNFKKIFQVKYHRPVKMLQIHVRARVNIYPIDSAFPVFDFFVYCPLFRGRP